MDRDRVRRPRCRSQGGETLIESLLSIVILGMVGLAAYAGFMVAIRSTAQHRDGAVAETVLRSAAEQLENPREPYVPRAGCIPGGPDYELEATEVDAGVVVDVEFWTSASDAPVSAPLPTEFSSTCPVSGDPGLQLIELSIDTPTGPEHLFVTKRRN